MGIWKWPGGSYNRWCKPTDALLDSEVQTQSHEHSHMTNNIVQLQSTLQLIHEKGNTGREAA